MVKKPGRGIDEAGIIRHRDGVADARSDIPLDSDARRALADARLRSLAFALNAEQSQSAKSEQPGDIELLAYLLDTLPEHQRIALERKLRGNVGAFGRLMTLRVALGAETEKRDLQRARRVPRYVAGSVDIRRRGENLQFRGTTQPDRSHEVVRDAARIVAPLRTRAASRLKDLRLERAQLEAAFQAAERRSSHLESAAGTEGGLGNLLERAQRNFYLAKSFVDDARAFLERWWNVSRHEGSGTHEGGARTDREAEDFRDRLTGLLGEMESVSDRILAELRMFPPAQRAASPSSPINAAMDLVVAERASFDDLRSPTDRKTWADAFDFGAGSWALHLTGTAAPTPQLTVSLHGNQEGTSPGVPFLTLVRPAEGFETVNLDSSGTGKIALLKGDSVMLLQGHEVWEVRLSFRDRGRT